MPLDITAHINPATTAVVSSEIQENLIGATSYIPGLAKSAADVGLIDNLDTLFTAARRVGSRVYYAIDTRRDDGFGHPANLKIVGRNISSDNGPGNGHGPIVSQLTPHPEDVVISRTQGMTAFFSTALDQYLRNTGITTVIMTGVSANIGVLGSTIEAMNLGYTVVVPSDCIAGDPPEYTQQLLRYTIRNIAFVVPSSSILDYWNLLPENPA